MYDVAVAALRRRHGHRRRASRRGWRGWRRCRVYWAPSVTDTPATSSPAIAAGP